MSLKQSNPFGPLQKPPGKDQELPKAADDRSVYEADENDVPAGSATEVLSWVGDDKERAQRALDAEQEKNNPRKGLSADLQHLLDK